MRILVIIILLNISGCAGMNHSVVNNNSLPDKFVFLADIDPTIVQNLRYYTNQNFLGRPVAGYKSNKVVCTEKAAIQLKAANDTFKTYGYKIVVYDAYRPEVAVEDFNKWAKDLSDQKAKDYYYPGLSKKDVFKLGYVASSKSSHSRGSTFDLTIIKADEVLKPIVYSKRQLKNGEEITFLDDNTVDMGSSFDLFHSVSDYDSKLIKPEQAKMREFLHTVMSKHGFRVCKNEWWHYTLRSEPYLRTYFNFIVENDYKRQFRITKVILNWFKS